MDAAVVLAIIEVVAVGHHDLPVGGDGDVDYAVKPSRLAPI